MITALQSFYKRNVPINLLTLRSYYRSLIIKKHFQPGIMNKLNKSKIKENLKKKAEIYQEHQQQ